MILDGLDRSSHYKGISPNLDRAIDLLDHLDDLSLKPGKNVIDNEIFIMRFSYETRESDKPLFEYHRDYIDIQLVLKGEELIGCSSLSAKENIGSFNEDGDVGLCTMAADCRIYLKPGHFALFFPEELHAPKLAVDRSLPVEKIVVKVKV